MPMILLIIVAATLLLVAGIIIIILRRGFGPFKTKEGHLMGPHELFPVVIDQLESFLHEQSDKLMATVADIEAHAEQLQQLGYKLIKVSLYGPWPGLVLELEPGGLAEDAAFQELLHQKHKSKTFKLIVKLLQYIARDQRKYQFRDLTCKGKYPVRQRAFSPDYVSKNVQGSLNLLFCEIRRPTQV